MSAVEQLSSIPFDNLIGGPLEAAVEAQGAAAAASIRFINEVGLVSAGEGATLRKEAVTVSFQYKKAAADGNEQTFELTVPILAVLPVPFIRIETIDIDFTAKLTDVVTNTTTANTASAGGFSGSLGLKKFGLRGGYSRSKSSTSTTTSTSSADYAMHVKVRAVQSEMPAGMSRIIDILESAIKDTQKTN